MNRITQTLRSHSPAWATLLAVLALCLWLPGVARGQWATSPYNGNNISNTNTGSVGVGTNNPGNYRVHVYGVSSALDALIATFSGSHNVQFESQAGYKIGILNNYINYMGNYEAARGMVTLGYSNGPSANIVGYYSHQQVWHNYATAIGVYSNADADNASGAMGQQLFGGYFTAKTSDQTGGAGNAAYGLYAIGTVGASTNQSHVAFGVLARARAAAGTDSSVATYALYADATNSGAGRAYGVYSAAGTNYFNGAVGVGTSGPGYKLDVQGGQINASGGLCIAGDCRLTWSQVTNGSGSTQWTTAGTSIFYNSGNVGIGVGTQTPPGSPLTVNGTTGHTAPVLDLQGNGDLKMAPQGVIFFDGNYSYAAGSYIGPYSGTSGAYDANTIKLTTAGAERLRVTSGGNVGIGTAAPSASYKLDVQGGPINAGGGLCLSGDCKTSWPSGGQWLGTGNIYYNTGNVGIGTPSPATKLDVNGNTNVTGNITVTGANAGNITASGTIMGGNIQATYQDVAEWVPSTHALPAGTVVVLNPMKNNEVMASNTAYDTRVAGVVSARPGLALGEAGANKALIATTGRVKVKVDATKAPIHIGDLLVTSDREGYAMKSEPITIGNRQLHAPGTLIGKALEPLESGTGEILVLLSLQ